MDFVGNSVASFPRIRKQKVKNALSTLYLGWLEQGLEHKLRLVGKNSELTVSSCRRREYR